MENNIIKFVKMGMEIDHSKGLNHRIRTILKTDDNKYLFIEILQGTRPAKHYTNITKQNEYDEKYPNEHYIVLYSCFRVDIPEDFYKNYSEDFCKFQKSYYELAYTKENIIKLLQKFNKNVVNYELVDQNNFDIYKYCDDMGFYRLYNPKCNHTVEPLKIIYKCGNFAKIKSLYTCWNYDKMVMYQEYIINEVENIYCDRLKELYGIDTINILLEEYEENHKNLFKKG